MAPEKIEQTYLKSTIIAEIFVYGNSLQAYLVGIVVPNTEFVLQFFKSNKSRSKILDEVPYE